ncbi:MAG: CHRD domain-containing protein [Verrucomicrobia bacterium]|nr:CHRD domain-containing protein [Verrucomicrobiota bacterium]
MNRHARGYLWIGILQLLAGSCLVFSQPASLPLTNFPSTDGPVATLVATNGILYVGGSFTHVGGLPRTNLAAIDLTTDQVTDWSPQIAGAVFGLGPDVEVLAMGSNTVYVGGSFSSVNNQSRQGLAALDATSGALLNWNPGLVEGLGEEVHALLLYQNTLYVAGFFSSANGLARDGLAAIDAATGEVTGWAPNVANGWAFALASHGPTLYVGGAFGQMNGQARYSLAAFDLTTGALTPWAPGAGPPFAEVSHLLVSGNTVYIGGNFGQINGVPRASLAAVDAQSGELTSWAPVPNGGVKGLAPTANAIYLAGAFTALNGQPHAYLGALDKITGSPRAWNPPMQYPPSAAVGNAFAVTTNFIYAGGGFSIAQPGGTNLNLAAFPITNLPPVVSIVGLTNGEVLHLPISTELESQAQDPDDQVAKVDYYANGVFVGTATNAPYAVPWSAMSVGDYVVLAIATDQFGEYAPSDPITVTAIPPLGYVAPTLQIANLTNHEVLPPGTNVTVLLQPTATSSTIVTVSFQLGTNSVLRLTNAPYALVLTNLAPGDYSLSVAAVDNYGLSVTNGPTDFRVDFPPTVAITAPRDGVTIALYSNLVVAVQAADPAGAVKQVSLLADSTPLATATNAPFTFTVTSLALGTHDLQAIAVDDFGLSATSSVVRVSVLALLTLEYFGGDLQSAATLADPWTNVANSASPWQNWVIDTPQFYRLQREEADLSAYLAGDRQAPPVTSSVIGSAMFRLLNNGRFYLDVQTPGLTTNVTEVDLDGPANSRANARVLASFTNSAFNLTDRFRWWTTIADPTLQAAILEGQTYVNIKTVTNPGGELRGQITPVVLGATLSGTSEAPQVNTPATGTATLWLVGNVLSWNVSYTNLSSRIVAGYILGPAAAGATAGSLIPFTGFSGTSGTIMGSATITNTAWLGYIADGLTYVNLESTNHPAGELRGQIGP